MSAFWKLIIAYWLGFVALTISIIILFDYPYPASYTLRILSFIGVVVTFIGAIAELIIYKKQ